MHIPLIYLTKKFKKNNKVMQLILEIIQLIYNSYLNYIFLNLNLMKKQKLFLKMNF